MKITRQTSTELVLADSSMWISILCAGVAVAIIVFAIERGKIAGFLVAALFLVFAAISLRGTRFSFDSHLRTVSWTGRKMFKVESGVIPFDGIKDIGTEATSGNKGATTSRLTIITQHGSVPMAYEYSGGRDQLAQMRRAILAFIKLEPAKTAARAVAGPASSESSVRSLLAQGRQMDAVELLRSSENLGLTEAMQRIEAIDTKMKAGN